MGRYRRKYDEGRTPNTPYAMAFKKMKRIKGFYVHLAIYLIFNTIIILIGNTEFNDANSGNLGRFSLAFYWGIGLAAHGASVFGRDLFFGRGWEERKIRQFMDKDKNNKWE